MARNDEIRELIAGGATVRELTAKYGICRQRISQILCRSKRPQAWQAKSKLSLVYAVRVGDFIKIGIAADMSIRLENLRANNPYPVEVLKIVRGGRLVEAALHERFASAKHHHEWFRATDEILAWVAEPPDPLDCVESFGIIAMSWLDKVTPE